MSVMVLTDFVRRKKLLQALCNKNDNTRYNGFEFNLEFSYVNHIRFQNGQAEET